MLGYTLAGDAEVVDVDVVVVGARFSGSPCSKLFVTTQAVRGIT